MRLNGKPAVLVCRTPGCRAKFNPASSRLGVPGVRPLRGSSKTLAEINRIVKNEGRRLLKARRRKILRTVSADASLPEEVSAEELLILVLESPHAAAQRLAFDRLEATGSHRQLKEIAASTSPYAEKARSVPGASGAEVDPPPRGPGE